MLASAPGERERTTIALGALPSDLEYADRVGRAVAQAALTGVLRRDDPDEPIRVLIEQAPPTLEAADDRWYSCLIIDRDIQLAVDYFDDRRRFVWLDLQYAMRAERDYLAYCQPHLDALSMVLALHLGAQYLEHTVTDDRVVFLSAGREPFRMLRGTAGIVRVSVTGGPGPAVERLEAAAARVVRPGSGAPPLSSAQRWYVQALRERDPVKAFLWTFLALEIVANKLCPEHFDRVVKQLELRSGQREPHEGSGLAIGELVSKPDRLPLVAKFAVLALALKPETAGADVRTSAPSAP